MKAVIDTNIIIDALAVRQPFFEQSKAVLQLAAQGGMEGAVTANTITDIAYLLRKHLDKGAVKTALMGLMELLEVLEVNRQRCIGAFGLPMSDYDYEDALLAHCAQMWGAECIVTRNTKDFDGSPVKALTPDDFVKMLV